MPSTSEKALGGKPAATWPAVPQSLACGAGVASAQALADVDGVGSIEAVVKLLLKDTPLVGADAPLEVLVTSEVEVGLDAETLAGTDTVLEAPEAVGAAQL